MTRHSFSPGINSLLTSLKRPLAGKRIALISHPAAVDGNGTSSAELLMSDPDIKLVACFGPEHGFWGTAPAGEFVQRRKHPYWDMPVFSLYGGHRKPTARMLAGIDALVFDVQDLGARPYTYVATLRLILEAAAEYKKNVVVADRPIPLPSSVDGPSLDPRFQSFVASIPAPMAYGMTPGETALWLKAGLGLDVDLQIAKMKNYNRQPHRQPDWPPWIPPSPEIRSWESGYCYVATVFAEAIPSLDIGRGTSLAFQVLAAPWTKGPAVCEKLSERNLPGVKFHPHYYAAGAGAMRGRFLDGIRITVTDPDSFAPATAAAHIIDCLQQLYGAGRLWRSPGARWDFFDGLFGTDAVRKALMAGESAAAITGRWRSALTSFKQARSAFLLYYRNTGQAPFRDPKWRSKEGKFGSSGAGVTG